jgi:hypothetical protein
MHSNRTFQFRAAGPALLLLTGSLLLNGCALNGGGSSSTSAATAVGAVSHSGGFSGVVHGGQQPVTGSTIILWAAGTGTGYGAGATKLASTTTDADGNFNLDVVNTAPITAYSVASNIATFTAVNTFAVGESVALSGFGTSTFFNGQSVTVASATSSSFTADVTAILPVADNGNVGATTESGSSAYQSTNSVCTTGQNLYLTATGGVPVAGKPVNSSLAMMAAIPAPCSTASGTTSVFIDEVTTVAAVTALQQFMSINTAFTPPYTGTGTVPWTIGAPSTNTVGLANAFLQSGNLAFISSGTSGVGFPSNTVTPNNSTTSQLFTTTVTPEFSKIYGLADVLATCINDTTGNLCTGSAGVLTLTTITTGGTTPTDSVPGDTIQAMYNMATLPNTALLSTSGTARYWKSSVSGTSYLSTLWANINSQAPFQPYLATTPVDTTIGVQWKTIGPTSGTTGTVYAGSVAVDGKGDVWVGAGSGVTSNYITQFTPAGQLLQDIVTVNLPSYTFSFYPDSTTATTATVTANATQALGYARPEGIAIDTNNNAWFNAYGVTTPGTVAGEPTGVLAMVSQSGTATGYLTGSVNGTISIDGSNNLFISDQPVAGRYYLSMLSSASSWQSDYEGVGRGTAIYNGMAQDSTGYVWGFGSSCTANAETLNRINAAGMLTTNGTTGEANVTLTTNCAYQGAGDANGNMWTTDGTNLHYINIASSTTAPTVTEAFVGGTGTGLLSVNSVAVDGAGNVWALNKGTTTAQGTAGVAEFATNGTAGTAALLSPAGTASEGFGSSFGLYLGSPQGLAIDPSGNMWFATAGGSQLYYLVGVAAPTRTPLSASYAHIGTKP